MTFPPPLPTIRKKPLHVGTWVTGYNVLGTFGLIGHKGHVFVIMSEGRRATFSNSGYQQNARCLVCRDDLQNVDGEFLQVPVDDDFLNRCLAMVDKQMTHLRDARRALLKGVVPW